MAVFEEEGGLQPQKEQMPRGRVVWKGILVLLWCYYCEIFSVQSTFCYTSLQLQNLAQSAAQSVWECRPCEWMNTGWPVSRVHSALQGNLECGESVPCCLPGHGHGKDRWQVPICKKLVIFRFELCFGRKIGFSK